MSRHRVGFNNSPLTVCTAGQLVKRYGIRTRCNESVMRPGAATFFFFWQVNAMMTDDHRGPCTKKRGTSEDHTRLCEKKKNVDGSRAGRQTLSRSHNYFEFSEMGCSIKWFFFFFLNLRCHSIMCFFIHRFSRAVLNIFEAFEWSFECLSSPGRGKKSSGKTLHLNKSLNLNQVKWSPKRKWLHDITLCRWSRFRSLMR